MYFTILSQAFQNLKVKFIILENHLCFSCDGSNSVSTKIRNDIGVGTTINGSMYFLV